MSIEKISSEYNPFDGTLTETGVEDDKMVVRQECDVSAALEYAKRLRNADEYSSDGIKKGFWHVATLTPITILELKKIGVDIYSPGCSGKDIVNGLKRIHADGFITTRKRV